MWSLSHRLPPEKLRLREEKALQEAAEAHAEDVAFHKWTQYEFFRQWGELRQYANAAGVKIIGDMPVYVSYDSADCWASPEQFQLDENLAPRRVAGVPPDDFAEEGQMWGNPLYDWDRMKKEGYRWWISRMLQNFHLYDVLRLDHFRGYEAYYSTEADADNAMNGTWTPGPGMDLFRQLHREGTTLIVVTHDPEVAEAAQRTVVLEHGRVAREIVNENFVD